MSEIGVWRAEDFAGKYLSITSFRRDGTPVATPVWFVRDGGRLLVHTGADSYKVKRIRRNPSVRIAVCSARGALRGEPVPATAELLPNSTVALAERLMADKYRIEMVFLKPLRALRAAMGREPKPVILAIAPAPPDA